MHNDLHSIETVIKELQDRLLSKQEILEKLFIGLKNGFHFSNVSIYLINADTEKITLQYPKENAWPLPTLEKKWLLIQHQTAPPISEKLYYIADRSTFKYIDPNQRKKDIKTYAYPCDDSLFIILCAEDKTPFGIVCASNWSDKKKIGPRETDPLLNKLISTVETALDNLLIHQKIENLMSDRKILKERLQKDEESLKRRILELSVLYDTSTTLGNTLNRDDIVRLIIQALYKVLHFDLCVILLLEFVPEGELITHLRTPIQPSLLKEIQNDVISGITPFTQKAIDPEKITYTQEETYTKKNILTEPMRSFANIPLLFKEEIIGMLNVCSAEKHTFSKNEMTFLHTMSNQLASHLGRLKIIQQLEKSKMGSLIQSMTDAVIMLNSSHQIEIINPAARALFSSNQQLETDDKLMDLLIESGIYSLYQKTIDTQTFLTNHEITFNNKILNTNISPVIDNEDNPVGTVMVFRDITEIQKINRVKTQRLEVIAQVDQIINSISNLENLLNVLMNFILSIAHAEMGAIQLKIENNLFTKVHANFPDKVRNEYKFQNGETITDHVNRTQELYYIEKYFENPAVNPNVKTLIDSYICIPIIVQNQLIGLIHIARKFGSAEDAFTPDDINTLLTITSLSGTSIYSALLYQDNLKKQTIDQELKVAHAIQKRLLPSTLPKLPNVTFGACSIPAHEIGGDYYDFFELKENCLGIIVADIVGKGIPAGLYMALLKSILHTQVPRFSSTDQTLQEVNKLLYNDPVVDKFVPLIYMSLDPKTHILKYCNAGHEPALLFRNNKFITMDTDGFPLGGDNTIVYEQKSVQLEHQDIILIFTDGITEARNAKHQLFGQVGLKNLIRNHHTKPAQELVDFCYKTIQAYCEDNTLQDDFTLLVLKVDLYTETEIQKIKLIKETMHALTSEKKYIKFIRHELASFTQDTGFLDSPIYDLKLAVNEAHANIIEHTYQNREDGKIVIKMALYTDRIVVHLKDFGGHKTHQKTTKGEQDLKELDGSGLGVFLIHTLMDNVETKKLSTGTELILTKYKEK
ncbi:MAG: GAF domain-containing protein [Candidatus Margulisbacteria bacterium]|nr:GAF domain-containing protein [Candidatus Margulisiibacteriota bacterium]